ncbi:hypothetical protein [Dysosmobacter sp.]
MEKVMGFVLAAAAAAAALPAALYGLRYQALRQKKRHGQLSKEEKKRQVKNIVLFVLCLLAVYGLGFASIRCFR